uniref:helix-turn-helix domain-containing protein n=1 Tax=Burkholderia arboris TaxID=488730 RepID=UPI003BEF4302
MTKKESLAKLAAELVDTIARLQREANVTDAELSRAMDLGQGTLSRLMSGETIDPRLSTIAAVAAYFSIPIAALFGEEKTGLVPVFHQSKFTHIPVNTLKVERTQFWIKTSYPDLGQFALILSEKERSEPLTPSTILIFGKCDHVDIGDLLLIRKIDESLTLAKIQTLSPLAGYDIEAKGKRTISKVSPSQIVAKMHEIVITR